MIDIDAKIRVKNILNELTESDAVILRALEDLLIVLVNKKIIDITEIPSVVVDKIKQRRKLRAEMSTLRKQLDKK
jgi:hypothetical protein